MKGPPQKLGMVIKDTVALANGGLVKAKAPKKGSKAMKEKMAKLRAMRKK